MHTPERLLFPVSIPNSVHQNLSRISRCQPGVASTTAATTTAVTTTAGGTTSATVTTTGSASTPTLSLPRGVLTQVRTHLHSASSTLLTGEQDQQLWQQPDERPELCLCSSELEGQSWASRSHPPMPGNRSRFLLQHVLQATCRSIWLHHTVP